MNNTLSLAISVQVAALLLGGCGDTNAVANTNTSAGPLVKCEGVNSCQGHGECAGPTGENACQGQNSCKGKGWISLAEEDCTKQGGKVYKATTPQSDAAPASTDTGKADAMMSSDGKAMPTKCAGINACAGKGACASKDNACQGHNSCAGKGWVEVESDEACIAKGGSVT